MKSKQENLYGKPQKKDHSSRPTVTHLSKLANACSLSCSAVGTTLIASILFGPRSILSYWYVQLASNCATGLLAAAVLLGLLGAVLSYSKKDNAIEGKVRETGLYEESNAFKTNEIKTVKTLLSDGNEINSNVLKSQKLSSEVLVNDLRRSSKTDSDSRVKETYPSADTPKSKTTAFYTEKNNCPVSQNQLVPVKRQYDVPPFQQCMTSAMSSYIPNRWNSLSNDKSGIDSVTEVVATKGVRFFSGNYAHRQEEYEVKQTTTFFKYPHLGSPPCKISEISHDQLHNEDIQKGFYSSQGTTKSQHFCDVISKFETLQFKQ